MHVCLPSHTRLEKYRKVLSTVNGLNGIHGLPLGAFTVVAR